MTAMPGLKLVEQIHRQADTINQSLEQRPDVGWFLHGHLVLEYQLKKRLVERRTANRIILDKLGFFTLVTMCHDYKIIDRQKRDVLLRIHALKNNFCRDLMFKPSWVDWVSLWDAAHEAFASVNPEHSAEQVAAAATEPMAGFERVNRVSLNKLFVQICQDI